MMIKLLKKMKGQKGFTLIELLVVVAIIGILAAIAVPRLMASQNTARGAKIVADLRAIDSAITMSLADGKTPTNTSLVSDGYLAAWPVPPTGAVKYPNGVSVKAPAATVYSVKTVGGQNGVGGVIRATLGDDVVETYTTTSTTPSTTPS